MELKPWPCPFCGAMPQVEPSNPEESGNAWGCVQCVNPKCPAKPQVSDDIDVADDRGSDSYKNAAIALWNRRATDPDAEFNRLVLLSQQLLLVATRDKKKDPIESGLDEFIGRIDAYLSRLGGESANKQEPEEEGDGKT